MNPTLAKFGYPDTTVVEYPRWVVLVRPQQATLGALVLACKEDATAFSAISPAAFAELPQAIAAIETTLRRVFAYDKINYLMLMMVDPNVHFHVVPRYATAKEFAGVRFTDPEWPRLPDLAAAPDLDAAMLGRIRDHLKQNWSAPA